MATKDPKEEIKGVEGWLSFFIFTLIVSCVINFIMGIIDVSSIFEDKTLPLTYLYGLAFLDFLYIGGLIGFAIYTIYSFVKLKPNAVFLGKMYLILIFLTNFIGVIFSGVTGEPLANETSFLDSSSMIFRSLIFSVIWFLYLTYSKRVNNTYPKEKRKSYVIDKVFFFCILAIPLVIYLLAFVGTTYETSLNSTMEASCAYPKMMIGDECCAPNTDFGIPMCNDEAAKLNQQLNNAVENKILTTEKTENIMGKFDLVIPPDYYAIRNAKAGYFDIPIMLISYDEYGNSLMIRVMYSESSNYGETIQDFYYDFKKGLDQSAPQALTTEPKFFENEKNSFEIAIFNMTANIGGIETFSAQALIKSDNDVLIVSYLSDNEDLFDYYYYEFENMVWSSDRVG